MATIQRKNVKQETLTTQELKDLIRIANEGYSATWLCDFAEILAQAGKLSLEIGTIPDDMNLDLRKVTKAQMVPSNRERIARSPKHLIKFNNRMDKTVSVVEKTPLADTVDDLEVEFNSLERSRELVRAVLKYPMRRATDQVCLEKAAQGDIAFNENNFLPNDCAKSKPVKNLTQRRWP